MALLKVSKKDEEMGEKKSTLTPEQIQAKLFYFHDCSHKFHLNTTSFAEHKALDFLYNELVGYKDEISEKLQGYMGKMIGSLKLESMPDYSTTASKKLAKEIMDFAKDLEEYAEDKEYCDIENIAQGLSGVGAKTNYLLMLS
jgi:DNA-binding ferritin-like protein